MKHEGFPSEETLAAFINHELEEGLRRQVVRHLASCNECYETWAAANKPLGARRTSAKRLLITVCAFVMLVLVAAPARRRFASNPGVDALIASARDSETRAIAPRLSAAFEYRPLQKVTRGKEHSANDWRLADTVLEIRKKTSMAPTAENLHMLGVAYLLLGRVEPAVQTLEQAGGTKSDAAMLNDLAAAYYARGLKQANARDLARSLEISDVALAISSGNLSAQFNRALALEALENRPAARTAWHRYLQLDPSSDWAVEARQHVSRLSAPTPSAEWETLMPLLLRLSAADLNEAGSIAQRFPLRVRRLVENELLPRWARSRDGEDAARVLAGLTAIGTALEARYGDPTVADIARNISTGNPQRLQSLRRGYLAYEKARAAMGNDTILARDSFRNAWKYLRDAESPSVYAAGMFVVSHEYALRDHGEALRVVAALKSEGALRRYAPLEGQVLWMEGMVLLASGRPYESLQRYREARRAFERTGEIESIGAVDSLIAENLQALGDDDQAWTHRLRALRAILDYADSRRQRVAFNEAAEAAMQQNQLSLALEYQTTSIALVAGIKDAGTAPAYSHLWRALILGRKGHTAAAFGDIDRARAYAASVNDVTLRMSTTADIDMAEALLRQAESPAEAIPLFTRVLEYQHSGGYEFRRAQLLLARGRAHVRTKDDVHARSDFSQAIAAVESQREPIPDLRLRSAFFGRADDAYEELTALLVRAGEFDEALRVFDRSCERTLTELVPSANKAAPTSPRDGTVLVEIAVLSDEVVAWTVRHSGRSVSRHPIPSGQVEALVRSYEQAIAADSESVPMIGSRLYDILIRPLGLDASDDETVIFIPDPVLRGVPLASLYDRSRGQYLIENFAIATAPSAAVYWHCVARRANEQKTRDIVAIGNTKTAALLLDLPDLPEAERELTEIAARSRGRLLLDHQATASALLAAASNASIVHFAGHALVNEQDRGRSALVLAPEGRDASSALLYADQIAHTRLRAPLVVLSACTTNSTTARAAEGVVDVARAFLAAGVPTVVTSRWAVADDSARDLLTNFARQVAASVPPAEALRRAQLDMLQRGDPAQRAVRAWCAFEVIGAV